MPTAWNAETDRKLLLAIITVLSPSPPNWKDVAAMMGEDFTLESCRQHYAKIKKGAPDEFAATPKKPKGPRTPPTATGRKRKQSATKAAQQVDGDDGEDDNETPTKKSKMEAVKQEASEDD